MEEYLLSCNSLSQNSIRKEKYFKLEPATTMSEQQAMMHIVSAEAYKADISEAFPPLESPVVQEFALLARKAALCGGRVK